MRLIRPPIQAKYDLHKIIVIGKFSGGIITAPVVVKRLNDSNRPAQKELCWFRSVGLIIIGIKTQLNKVIQSVELGLKDIGDDRVPSNIMPAINKAKPAVTRKLGKLALSSQTKAIPVKLKALNPINPELNPSTRSILRGVCICLKVFQANTKKVFYF